MINIKSENFKKEVLESEGLVLVDFWASWCSPCRAQGAILESFNPKVEDKVKIVKINVDEEEELASLFNVRSIPTLVVFKDGKVLKSEVGVHDEETLMRMLDI